MLRFPTLTIFVLAAAFVAAQTPSKRATYTSVPQYPPDPCVVKCNSAAADTIRCAYFDDFTCVCPSLLPFLKSTVECMKANCSDQAAKTVEGSYIIYCAGFSTVSSGTGTPAPGTSGPSTSVAASGTASTTRSSATGAAFKNAPVAGAMGAMGALVGAAIF